MSMKGVEMQIAVPRTSEATTVQNQLNHKPAYDQSSLAAQEVKRNERTRKTSAEVDASAFLNVKEDGKGAAGGRRSGYAKKAKAPTEERGANERGHPFKGKHIDISL